MRAGITMSGEDGMAMRLFSDSGDELRRYAARNQGLGAARYRAGAIR
jgi:hypothetical protein